MFRISQWVSALLFPALIVTHPRGGRAKRSNKLHHLHIGAAKLMLTVLVAGLLNASVGADRAAAESPAPTGLPKPIMTAIIGPWEASVIRLPDGSLQGVALIGGGSFIVGSDRLGIFLACRDKAWIVGFTGSYGMLWDEFVTSVKTGSFADETVDIPYEETPIVLYKILGGLPGRADWRLGSVEARAAPTLVLWIGTAKVNFQVSLDAAQSARLLAGAPAGGDLSVTLPDGMDPWLLAEFPPFADVMAFFLDHQCGKPIIAALDSMSPADPARSGSDDSVEAGRMFCKSFEEGAFLSGACEVSERDRSVTVGMNVIPSDAQMLCHALARENEGRFAAGWTLRFRSPNLGGRLIASCEL